MNQQVAKVETLENGNVKIGNIEVSGDFTKYYDATQKRNIWILGYWGGGSIEIEETYELAKEYAKATNVPLKTVKIDEVLSSRRFKHFKFMYSTFIQDPEPEAVHMDNVYAWLRE